MTKEKKLLGPGDEEFKKAFAAAVTEISYCEMYPNAPSCQWEEEEDEWEDEYCEDAAAVCEEECEYYEYEEDYSECIDECLEDHGC